MPKAGELCIEFLGHPYDKIVSLFASRLSGFLSH